MVLERRGQYRDGYFEDNIKDQLAVARLTVEGNQRGPIAKAKVLKMLCTYNIMYL